MPEAYTIKDQFGNYFLTFQLVGWVDLFTRKCYRDIVVESFNYCVVHKKLNVHAWVVMSNHVHCILSSRTGELSAIVRDLKKYTARAILQSVFCEQESRREWLLYQFRHAARQHVRNKEFQVWTHENHAVEIDPYIKNMGESKLDYIHQNPVRAGWVDHPEEYIYSSARDYVGQKGLVKLEMW